ncbi:hypothetical protein B0H13DRAFT_1853516 [Mycena leptocephala]|nr:hypothetical protein B0H13DRAFT_1853516 [Mycena leptocephala]
MVDRVRPNFLTFNRRLTVRSTNFLFGANSPERRRNTNHIKRSSKGSNFGQRSSLVNRRLSFDPVQTTLGEQRGIDNDGRPGRPSGEQRGIDKTSLRDLLGNRVRFVFCAVIGVRDAHQESREILTNVTSLMDLLGNRVTFVLCEVMGIRDAHQESMDCLTSVTGLRDLLGNRVRFVFCAVMGVRDAHQESREDQSYGFAGQPCEICPLCSDGRPGRPSGEHGLFDKCDQSYGFAGQPCEICPLCSDGRPGHQESMDCLTSVTGLRDLLGNRVRFVFCAVMGVRDAHH